MSQQEPDENNFTSSSSHRLPTVSAASAFQNLSRSENRFVSTSLTRLDYALGRGKKGGLVRGHVTEVYGPPGAGKTSIAIQAASNALRSDQSVVWIDTSHQVVGSRIAETLSQDSKTDVQDPKDTSPQINGDEDMKNRLHHFRAPSLPHLLALTSHYSPSFPPPGTSLVVIDNVTSTFATAFPRVLESDSNGKPPKSGTALQWASSRRWAVMADFTARMSRLASTHNIAVLVISQTSTKVRTEYGALLRPSMVGKGWLENINTRLVVFRDFVYPAPQLRIEDRDEEENNVRFIGIVKHAGILDENLERKIMFCIRRDGLHQLSFPLTDMSQTLPQLQKQPELPILPSKRKHIEVADSEDEAGRDSDENFDWIEDDPLAVVEEEDEPTITAVKDGGEQSAPNATQEVQSKVSAEDHKVD